MISGCSLFGQLKTRKGASDANEAIHFRWLNAAFSGETRKEERADLVCAVQIENLFFREEQSWQEVVRKPGHFGTPIKDGQRALG